MARRRRNRVTRLGGNDLAAAMRRYRRVPPTLRRQVSRSLVDKFKAWTVG